MQRRTLFSLLLVTAVISVVGTLAMMSAFSSQFQPSAIEKVVTFVVLHTDVPGPTQTPYIITVIPDGLANVPTGVFETPDLTRNPPATLDAEAISANPAAQETVTSLPENCLPHVLEEGQNPSIVADLYGVNLFTLMAVNGLDEESAQFLQVGDVLIVPLEGCALEPPPTPIPSNTPQPTTAGATASAEATEESEVTFTPSPSPTTTLAPTAANAQISIVEVTSAGDVTAEAVKIHNNGETVNVTGWTLSDSQGNTYDFPDNQLIFSNADVTVFTRDGRNTPVVFFWGQDEAVWGEPGDIVTLKDDRGRVQATLRLP